MVMRDSKVVEVGDYVGAVARLLGEMLNSAFMLSCKDVLMVVSSLCATRFFFYKQHFYKQH